MITLEADTLTWFARRMPEMVDDLNDGTRGFTPGYYMSPLQGFGAERMQLILSYGPCGSQLDLALQR